MFPVLFTNRLVLNRIEDTDVKSIFSLRSDEEVARYVKRGPDHDIQQAYDFIRLARDRYENKSAINWAIRKKETPDLIGGICLWKISADRKTAEIGYDLKPLHHGKGIMSEAMVAIIEYGFSILGLDKIEAFTSRYNEASKSLLLKHNFILNPERIDEDNMDNLIFELKRNPTLQQVD
ncbi:GNAT family N-acetyltransferase [Elizabethkingia ursingii]|uniref:GNAT family N-acetyltransferase n=1 Tax=Elizabethkingia ursingii TaxID=1756150 RepID=UPI002012C79B|nr:GNAT family N-acetyltransferase [Elizabethkingia ursingii]MCL1671597.1 GNAT family N-acetyltransferase [Elizabethkingia ursingii]